MLFVTDNREVVDNVRESRVRQRQQEEASVIRQLSDCVIIGCSSTNSSPSPSLEKRRGEYHANWESPSLPKRGI